MFRWWIVWHLKTILNPKKTYHLKADINGQCLVSVLNRGSDYSKSGHLKIRFQMLGFSKGRVIAKYQPFEKHFCLDFKKFDKVAAICPDFKWIPFKIRTIYKPTTFWPFEIQTWPVFRSPRSSIFKWSSSIFQFSGPFENGTIWITFGIWMNKEFMFSLFGPSLNCIIRQLDDF